MTVEVQQSQQNQQNSSSLEPPPYTPGYTDSPLDETVDVYNDFINIPDHEIAIIDKKFVTNKHVIYTLNEKYYRERQSVIKILDSDGYDQFQCKREGDRIIVFDEDQTPVLNISVKVNYYKKVQIYKGNSQSELYATIETSSKVTDDVRKYKMIVLNKANNEEEEIEMRYNKFRKYYSIYCNIGKNNETMIGAIKKLKINSFTVEIAPMVDYMFLFGLAALVIRLETIKKNIHDEKIELVLVSTLACVIS